MTDTAAPARPEQLEDRPKLQISATQITTGVVASTTSALLGSTLGVAGTILGAAIGAVAYSIAATLYSHSVAAAKHRLHVARFAHGTDDGTGIEGAVAAGAGIDDAPTAELSNLSMAAAEWVPDGELAIAGGWETADEALAANPELTADLAVIENPTEPVRPGRPRNPRRPRLPGSPQWRSVLAGSLGSAVAFGLALLLVTGLESAKGAPLSGGESGGLSVLGGSARVQPDSEPGGSVTTTTNITVVHSVTETSTAVVTESRPADEADRTEPDAKPTAPADDSASTTVPVTPTTAPSTPPAAPSTAPTDAPAESADPQPGETTGTDAPTSASRHAGLMGDAPDGSGTDPAVTAN